MFHALRADIDRYNHAGRPRLLAAVAALYSHPAFAGIVWYRLGHACWLRRRNPICWLLLVGNRLLYPLVRIYSGLELAPQARIGEGLYVGHFGSTVIHPDTVAGCQLTLHQGVTIGGGRGGVPRLGDRVSFGAGASAIGGIQIGDGAIVAAGAVVTADVPADTIVAGVPARPLRAGGRDEKSQEGYP